MKILNHLSLRTLLFLAVALTSLNMGKAGENYNTGRELRFSPLDTGVKSLKASVIDNNKTLEVRDISFTGKTSISGIRKEDDTANLEIDLGKTRELIVKNQNYISQRYGDQKFILVDYIALDGTRLNNLLFPDEIIFSAISMKGDVKETWRLRNIEKIIMHNLLPA